MKLENKVPKLIYSLIANNQIAEGYYISISYVKNLIFQLTMRDQKIWNCRFLTEIIVFKSLLN